MYGEFLAANISGRTSSFDPCFYGDAGEDHCCACPLSEGELVVVDHYGKDHREHFAGQCDCPVRRS